MKAIYLIVILGTLAVAYGLPLEGNSKPITGYFIPSDAFQNLQDRANDNSPNGQPIQGSMQAQPTSNTPQPNYQPIQPNQPQYQPPVMTNQLPPQNNQKLTPNNQPIASNMQPVMSNQPLVYTQQPLAADRDPNASNQPIIAMTNQPNGQSNQPIVLVQQPSSNQPIYVQQPTQLPNQGYVLSNAQPNQPTQVIIATNPSNGNQMQGTLVATPNQNQPGSTVYTLIPLNGQNNFNSNSGASYIIPVQSGNSNPIILSSRN